MNEILIIKQLIEEADAILIGAGAGLSDAAGIHYNGEEFEKEFEPFIKKYHFNDLYSSSFYNFKTEEEKWAYWAKHIYYAYYKNQHTKLYKKLYNLVKNKEYFVITTNTDGQFINNGFDSKKVFEVQGNYSKLQCSIPCHNKLYNNKKEVLEMLEHTNKDLKIPKALIPKCPICGRNMSVNLRCDETFVEDDNWHQLNKNYEDFLKNNLDKKVLLLEFGAGYNTPGIIRFPFEEMAYIHDNFRLVRFNKKDFEVPDEIKNKSISISNNIDEVINEIMKEKR